MESECAVFHQIVVGGGFVHQFRAHPNDDKHKPGSNNEFPLSVVVVVFILLLVWGLPARSKLLLLSSPGFVLNRDEVCLVGFSSMVQENLRNSNSKQ